MAFQFGSKFTGQRQVAPSSLRDFGSNMNAGGTSINTPDRGNIFQEQADIAANVKRARATAANPVVAQPPATDLTETATTSTTTPTDTATTTDYGDYTLKDIYNPAITQYSTEQDRLQAELDAFKESQESDLQKQYRLIEEEQRAIFNPRYEEATRAGEAARETALRGAAFRGAGRSSRTVEQEADIDRVVGQQRAALAAEQAAAIRLQRAAAEGASDAQLESLQNQVTTARDKRTELERELATKQAGLTEAQIEAGQQAEANRLKARVAALEAAGLTEDPDTGERVETLKAQAQQFDQAIATGKLSLEERGLELKEFLGEAQFAKMIAETEAILKKTSSGGSGSMNTSALNLTPAEAAQAAEILAYAREQGISAGQAADELNPGSGTANIAKITKNAVMLDNFVEAQRQANNSVSLNGGKLDITPIPKTPEVAPEAPTTAQTLGQEFGTGIREDLGTLFGPVKKIGGAAWDFLGSAINPD